VIVRVDAIVNPEIPLKRKRPGQEFAPMQYPLFDFLSQ
jgi:hypothetical protein